MRLLKRLQNPDSRFTVRELLLWLWRVLKGNRRQTLLNAVIGILGVGVSLLMVMAMQHTIEIASGEREGRVLLGVVMMGTLILCEFALNILRVWIKNILGVRAQNLMQQQILDRLLRSEWQGKNAYHTGDIINRLEQDVKTVVGFITETLPNTVSVIMMFLGAFGYLLQMDAWLAVTTVGILPLFVAVSRIYVAQMRKLSRRVRKTDSRIQNLLTEVVQNMTLLKTLEAGSLMVGHLEEEQAELRSHVRRRTKFSIASNLFVNGGFSLGYLIAFLWSAVRLSAHTITFGQMTAFMQLVYRIQGPAREMTRLAPAFVSVFTAAERLLELEAVPVEQQGKDDLFQGSCGIRIKHVSYQYNGATSPVIHDMSFDFKPGSCTAILGETGAGKTTLIRLILALMRPSDGHVEIYNNERATDITPLHRCNLVYVPQGNTLLSGTIRDNLLLANPKATDEQLWAALKMACADFVERLPEQLDTVCSESGGGLSEGQAQRIAVARALLRDRPVMLFDEATSALDMDTERRLLKQVLGSHQKTVIFITHRTAVVDYCDQTLRVG